MTYDEHVHQLAAEHGIAVCSTSDLFEETRQEDPFWFLQDRWATFDPKDPMFSAGQWNPRERPSRRKVIYIVLPVRSETEYFGALHELGHLIAKGGGNAWRDFDDGLDMQREGAAWQWALDNAMHPPSHKAAEWIKRVGIGSYAADPSLSGQNAPTARAVMQRLHAL